MLFNTNISNKKRLLFIFHDSNMTGASISLFRIIKVLVTSNKYEIFIHISKKDGQLIKYLKELNINIYSFNRTSGNSTHLTKVVELLYYYVKVFLLYLKIKPNLIYANTLFNVEQLILARLLGIKTIVHVHEAQNIMNCFKDRIQIADKFTTAYFVVSNYSLECLSAIVGNKKNKYIVKNGLEINQKCKLSNNNSGNINLSIIATIDRNKSQLDGIKALEVLLKYHNFKLSLFGKITDEGYYNELITYINEHKLNDNISFKGEIINQNEIYENSDFVLITSLDESFSLIIIEGFLHCVPVISSDNKGAMEIISNGITGLVYKYGNCENLAENILYLLDNQDKTREIIKNAYNEVVKYYNINVISNNIEALIEKVLQQ